MSNFLNEFLAQSFHSSVMNFDPNFLLAGINRYNGYSKVLQSKHFAQISEYLQLHSNYQVPSKNIRVNKILFYYYSQTNAGSFQKFHARR